MWITSSSELMRPQTERLAPSWHILRGAVHVPTCMPHRLPWRSCCAAEPSPPPRSCRDGSCPPREPGAHTTSIPRQARLRSPGDAAVVLAESQPRWKAAFCSWGNSSFPWWEGKSKSNSESSARRSPVDQERCLVALAAASAPASPVFPAAAGVVARACGRRETFDPEEVDLMEENWMRKITAMLKDSWKLKKHYWSTSTEWGPANAIAQWEMVTMCPSWTWGFLVLVQESPAPWLESQRDFCSRCTGQTPTRCLRRAENFSLINSRQLRESSRLTAQK